MISRSKVYAQQVNLLPLSNTKWLQCARRFGPRLLSPLQGNQGMWGMWNPLTEIQSSLRLAKISGFTNILSSPTLTATYTRSCPMYWKCGQVKVVTFRDLSLLPCACVVNEARVSGIDAIFPMAMSSKHFVSTSDHDNVYTLSLYLTVSTESEQKWLRLSCEFKSSRHNRSRLRHKAPQSRARAGKTSP